MRRINEPKLKRVLHYIADNPGPTLREIMRDCELSSTSVASTQVDRLIARGLVKREWGLSRTIRAVPSFVNSKGERWFDVSDKLLGHERLEWKISPIKDRCVSCEESRKRSEESRKRSEDE